MSKMLDRRVRQLESGAHHDGAPGRYRTVYVHPGECEADKIAALPDRMPGDGLIIVTFVAPGDVSWPMAH